MSDHLECEQQLLVQAEFDGELSAAESLSILTHRRQCEHCTKTHRMLSGVAKQMRDLPREAAPQSLRAAVRDRTAQKTPRVRNRYGQWLSGALVGAMAASVAMLLVRAPLAPLEGTLVDDHVRALQSPAHLLDVESSEHHVVKPWFAGRIDFAPPVKDLATIGYPLMGARTEVIEGRSVAVLVYQAGRHTIDLFIQPTQSRKEGIESSIERGFNVRHWNREAMSLWAVSDLNAHELDAFVSHWNTST
ncbi:MAG: anti-sigma factor family protein [Povalibacter sp.]